MTNHWIFDQQVSSQSPADILGLCTWRKVNSHPLHPTWLPLCAMGRWTILDSDYLPPCFFGNAWRELEAHPSHALPIFINFWYVCKKFRDALSKSYPPLKKTGAILRSKSHRISPPCFQLWRSRTKVVFALLRLDLWMAHFYRLKRRTHTPRNC